MSADNKDEVVREVESPTAIFRNIKKQPGAPYVAGLEPESYGPPARMGDVGDYDGAAGAPGGGIYYESSTRFGGVLMILSALLLVAMWHSVYHTEVAGGTESYGNGAPLTQGQWAAVEFSLDKIRILETLKLFPVGNDADLSEWIQHRVFIQALMGVFAVIVVSKVAITLARAVPVFTIFCVPGVMTLAILAVAGDTFMVVQALKCFDVTGSSAGATTLTIKGVGCKLPLMMHAVCANVKWVAFAVGTAMLVIPIRFSGGFSFGIFRWVNLTGLSCLPVVAHALRIYLWYSALNLPAEAVAQHGWMLTHQEDIINTCMAACLLSQAVVWLLLGVALIGQGTLVVLEQGHEKMGDSAAEDASGAGEKKKTADAKKND